MADEVILNKAAVIERCLGRITEEYEGNEDELETNYTRQDAIVLNLLRASEAAIDLAMHIARVEKLGLPQESREAFSLLEKSGWIEPDLSRRLRAMVGFSQCRRSRLPEAPPRNPGKHPGEPLE